MNYEEKLWLRVDKYLLFLRFVPFLRAVAVCNNLAFSRVDEESDIDLFIVAREGRLFIVRIFVTLILHVLGVRRHGRRIKSRFCLSFFIDDDTEGMDFSKIAIKDDVYLKAWILNLKPVIERNSFFDDFLHSNLWVFGGKVEKLSFEFKSLDRSHLFENFERPRFLEFLFGGKIGDLCERVLSMWQLRRAGRKAMQLGPEASVVVNKHMLKFHNHDRRAHYRNLYRKKYNKQDFSINKFLDLDF